MQRLRRYDIGLNRSRLAVLDLDVTEAGYDIARAQLIVGQIVERLRSLPGVKAVMFSQNGLFTG